MMDQADMVRAVAFVELCKERYGHGITGHGGTFNAAAIAEDREQDDELKRMWRMAAELSDAVRRIEALENEWKNG